MINEKKLEKERDKKEKEIRDVMSMDIDEYKRKIDEDEHTSIPKDGSGK